MPSLIALSLLVVGRSPSTIPHFILYFKKNPFWSITLNKGSYQLFIFAHKILLKLTLCFWEAEAGCRGWDTLGPEVFVYSCRISWSIASLWCRTPPCFISKSKWGNYLCWGQNWPNNFLSCRSASSCLGRRRWSQRGSSPAAEKHIFLVSQNNGQGLCSKMCFLHF